MHKKKKEKDAFNKSIICQICIIYSFLVAVVGGFSVNFLLLKYIHQRHQQAKRLIVTVKSKLPC